MTFLRNIFICDAREGWRRDCAFCGIPTIYQLFRCSVLLEHPLQILKEHKKTSYSDMTLYLCLKWGLCRRFRWKRNLIVVKGLGFRIEASKHTVLGIWKACLFSSQISSFSCRVTAFCFKTTRHSINQLILREIESTVIREAFVLKKNLSPELIHKSRIELKGVLCPWFE